MKEGILSIILLVPLITIFNFSWSPSEAKHIGEIQMSHMFELFGKFKCFQMTIIGKQVSLIFCLFYARS